MRSDVPFVASAPDAVRNVATPTNGWRPVPALVVARLGRIHLLAEKLMHRDVAAIHGCFDHGRAPRSARNPRKRAPRHLKPSDQLGETSFSAVGLGHRVEGTRLMGRNNAEYFARELASRPLARGPRWDDLCVTPAQGGQPPLPEKLDWAKRASAAFFKVVAEAQTEVFRLGHDAIGPTHLLLGVLHEADPAVKVALRSLGITYVRTFDVGATILEPGTRDSNTMPPFSVEAAKALRLSDEISASLGYADTGPGDMVLAALQEADSDLDRVLESLGTTAEELHEGIQREFQRE